MGDHKKRHICAVLLVQTLVQSLHVPKLYEGVGAQKKKKNIIRVKSIPAQYTLGCDPLKWRLCDLITLEVCDG